MTSSPVSAAQGNPHFDAYIAVDWSGAIQRGYPGVAVAECVPGCSAPQLIAPPGARVWARSAVLEWLRVQLASHRKLLIGFDFAFMLPGVGMPGPELWAGVEAASALLPDLQGQAYIARDSRFWIAGRRPAGWDEEALHRPTERACRDAGLGRPQTPLKLIGAKQVGKGALAGMRLLHALRQSQPGPLCIWPFDGPPGPDQSVIAEIYPRLFIREAGFGDRKLRHPDTLDQALIHLESDPAGLKTLDDHQSDALIAAAGLRRIANRPNLWQTGRDPTEGWILGVPAPEAET